MDSRNVALDEEQFEKFEAALKRAREVQRTSALVELFDEESVTPIMDFAQLRVVSVEFMLGTWGRGWRSVFQRPSVRAGAIVASI
jgi:hypothetical protein